MPALAAALLIAVAAWRGAPTAQLSWGAAAAAPRLAAPRAGSRPGPRGSAIADGADPARAKLIKGGLPQKFAERVSFQTGGAKKAGQEEEILILWREFKKCYPNEKVALEMLSKNTAVILPTLNSPRKIKGTYALLNKRLGKKAAADLLLKNPGVLVCSPEGLEKQSDDDILKAADLVESLEKNKPLINGALFVVLLGVVAAFGYRIATVASGETALDLGPL
mmetsp:Transcript_21170/g.68238  ORF Transcript_21170/g.68238 Transcript_21170/m.68238 type:complete len:222 (-) Transcript_21170:730-1395(-)